MPERPLVPDPLSPGDVVWVVGDDPPRRAGKLRVPLCGAVGVLEDGASDGRSAWVVWNAATREHIPWWYRRLCEHHGRGWSRAKVDARRLAPWTSETSLPATATPFASAGMERLRRRAERVSELFELPPDAPWPPRTYSGLQAAERALRAKLDFPFAADAWLEEGERFVLVFDVFLRPADRASAEADPSAPLPPGVGLLADVRDEHRPLVRPLAALAARDAAARWVNAYRLWRGR